MIKVEHGYTLPGTAFAVRQSELRSPSMLVVRRRLRAARFSDHLFELSSRRPVPWPRVRVVLSGHVVASVDGHKVRLGPGDALLGEHYDVAPWTADSDDTDTIFVAWPDGPSPGTGVLPARTIPRVGAAARRLATSMRPGAPDTATAADTAELLAALTTEGRIDVPRIRSTNAAPPIHLRFAAALGAVLSQPRGWPMTVDLATALGIGERQTTRLAASYFRDLYVSVDSLGSYLAKSRMWLVTAAMTSPGARTDEVARHFGFSSPVALCHAFTAAGLPSPHLFRPALLDHAA